jgi:hypothetical protein
LHMLGMGSFSGLLLGLSLNYGLHFLNLFFTGLLLSGLVGYARLKSSSHQPTEIYSGFFVGAGVLTVLMVLL